MTSISTPLYFQPEDATGQLDYRYDEFGFKVEEEGTLAHPYTFYINFETSL